MKRTLLVFTLLLFVVTVGLCAKRDSSDVSGFYIGVTGGYTHNHLTTSTGYRPFSTYKDKGGFVAGIPIGYRINSWFAVHAEVSVLQKNYTWTRTEYYVYTPLPYHNVTNTYIQLPVMPRFSFGGKNLRGFCALGGFVGCWTDSRIKGMTFDNFGVPYNYNEKYNFDKRKDNRVEAGLAAGIGLEYTLKSFCTFVVEGRFYYSLTDMQKKYMQQQVPRYNNTFTVQAGVHFHIPHVSQKNK